jgi:chorismate synthase
VIENLDYKNWVKRMSIDPGDREEARIVTRPRPGHADLAGVLKYNLDDIRDVLERASARETTARVAVGGLARQILEPFGIDVLGYVVSIGSIKAATPAMAPDELRRVTEQSQVRVADAAAERAIIEEIDACKKTGDTLGGVVEVTATGLPVGLGSYVQWDRKLDARLAHALLSLQAVKGVEFGMGFAAAAVRGSQLHDQIGYDAAGRHFTRMSNNSGGTEGGMSTGGVLRVRAAMKPISTVPRALDTVDVATGETAKAINQRSDVCAVPAAGVVAEAMVALVLADAALEKFGGDSVEETRRNLEGYLKAMTVR